MDDIDFQIIFEGFNEGLAPLAHIDDKTFIGSSGQASSMQADILSKPGFLTQAPALADLANGNQSGIVTEPIRFILDKPIDVNTTYGVGLSRLFKITPSAVINDATWPKAIAGMTEGESVIRLKDNLFIFYNTATGGDIAAMPIATEIIDPTWGSVTVAGGLPLQKAPHPTCVKEDIILFGNGRYVGVYIEGSGTLDTKKLDFGAGTEVVDIIFNSNLWWIAVNSGGDARTSSEVYMYDGGALTNVLADEAAVGIQKIGFLYVLNGLVYVCFDDLSADGFTFAFIAGRQIKPLRYFKGSLPTHRQKTLYKNTILFTSGESIFSVGSIAQQLPLQISQLADGGLPILGGIAAPFGTPMIASSDNDGNARVAIFAGYDVNSNLRSVFTDTTKGVNLGKVKKVIVITKELQAFAKCNIYIEVDQAKLTSNVLEVTGETKTRHVFNSIALEAAQDLRIFVDYSQGDVVNDCPIRKIIILGNYVER